MPTTHGELRRLGLICFAALGAAILFALGCVESGGTTGAAGATGTAGTTGAAGTTGVAGTTGGAGTQGTAGATGAAGTGDPAGAGGTGDPTGTGGNAAGAGGSSGSTGGTGTGGSIGGRGGTTGGRGGGSGGSSAGRGGAGGSAAGTTGRGGIGGTGGSTGGPGGASARFSFFVTSIGALRTLSGSQNGFGGDLRYGETGDGAGLRGADKICTAIAEMSMPGSGAKGWHAFLSAPGPIHAIDRIGNGPWYDRMGRLFSASKANLIGFRPADADAAIKNDFPNENGVPNHSDGAPGCTGNNCPDNHDTLTGSDAQGQLYSGSSNPTCTGWTTAVGSAGKPRVGHSWPRMPSSTNTCMGGGGPMGGGGSSGSTTAGCYGHWMSSLDEAGCAAGVNLQEMGGPIASNPTVGSGGGYGGFYCFALTP